MDPIHTAADIFNILGRKRPQHAPAVVSGGALPYAALSYSAAGEDMCLRRAFKRRIMASQPGRYLDIGCAWPINCSNTYLFYTLGWRGVAVDANAEHAAAWAEARPEDVFVCAGVTDRTGDLILSRSRTNQGAHQVKGVDEPLGSEFVSSGAVKGRRMDDLFAQYFPDGDLQLLSMDIEGGEMTALRSNQWDRYRPQVIILECWGLDLHAPLAAEPIEFLVSKGYRLVESLNGNAILGDASAAL